MANAVASSTLLVADVALDSRIAGKDAVYTYRLDARAAPGQALLVPLGTRSVVGYVLRCYDAAPEELEFSPEQLRPALGQIGGLDLPPELMALVGFVSEEYLCPVSVALGAALPPRVQDRLANRWTLDEERLAESPLPLSQVQSDVVDTLRKAGGSLLQGKERRFRAPTLKALRALRAKGIVRQSQELAEPDPARKGQALLRLAPDEVKVETFLKKHAKRRPAQALTVARLRELEHPALTPADIKALCGITDQTLRALTEGGLLEDVDLDREPVARPPEPNERQRLAIEAILDPLRKREHREFLLFGVTGSGKTEVYLRAAAEALRAGRQVLYLVPEIALATQAIAHLRGRFGRRVAVLHSELAPAERLESWRAVRAGNAAMVLGARSALFAPLKDVGLIVMDEEHEGGYKQETAPRYHAAALARFLAKAHGCPLVFGSATPSVERYFEAESGRIEFLSLPERAASASLPDVHVEDLTTGFRQGKPSLFTEELSSRLAATIERGEQAILFLNRRAYAPFLICRDCGKHFPCPNCAVSLAYSRKAGRLRCHHCGYQARPPDTCPECSGNRIRPFGVGTEKVEEAVAEAFPGVAVARLDRDVARKRGALEDVLARFASGDIQVLVGTQMVAKGLNFPNVTLVGVIAADVSLNIPDFRASERTFQLLSQVAGRAGRGKSLGHVVIQTFNPRHTAVSCAQSHDYAAFYDGIREERREAGYPPFVRLANVVVSGENRTAVVEAAGRACTLLNEAMPDARILGPADCAIERIAGKWRRHLLIKMPPGAPPAPIASALEALDPGDASVVVDVDPHSLM